MKNNLNYGVIGNCRTAALISERGSIEWLCFPDFDSPSVFAALLDRTKGGSFGFDVPDGYAVRQSYVPHTNILSTRFASDEGEFEVLDYMPCYRSFEKEHYLPAELYRYIHFVKGRPRFRIRYDPAPNYAQGEVRIRRTAGFIESYSSADNKDRQYLYSSIPLQAVAGREEIRLEKDEFLLLSYNEKVIPIDIEREKIEYCRTLVYWLNWTNRTRQYTCYNEVVERSMLVLKLLSYYNGAMLAALTTSLPETVGEVRNWDYRFCWLRDASMSIETMFRVGHTGAARRFMKFIQSSFMSRHDYQIMYGIRGERKLTEVILEHLDGYKGSKPVRIGNDAYHQKQNDSFGYLMDLVWQYYRLMPGTLDEIEDMWEMVKSILATVAEEWRNPDKGIWEIRGEEQHFVSSKVMCWVALDRGARIAAKLGKEEFAARWREEAEAIRRDVMEHGWKSEIQSFSQAYGNLALDSSLLLMEPYGFIAANDPHYRKTGRSRPQGVVPQGADVPLQQRGRFRRPQLGIHDVHLLAHPRAVRHGTAQRSQDTFQSGPAIRQSLGAVQRTSRFRHQGTTGKLPASLFASGDRQHGAAFRRGEGTAGFHPAIITEEARLFAGFLFSNTYAQ